MQQSLKLILSFVVTQKLHTQFIIVFSCYYIFL